MSEAFDDFLGSSSGESHPAIKFKEIGDAGTGTIVRLPSAPVKGKDGMPDSWPITLDTGGEDGLRTLWVKGGFLAGAIADACRKHGTDVKLQLGGKLGVRLTEKRDTGKPQPANVYEAKYEPPAWAGVSVDDIF